MSYLLKEHIHFFELLSLTEIIMKSRYASLSQMYTNHRTRLTVPSLKQNPHMAMADGFQHSLKTSGRPKTKSLRFYGKAYTRLIDQFV